MVSAQHYASGNIQFQRAPIKIPLIIKQRAATRNGAIHATARPITNFLAAYSRVQAASLSEEQQLLLKSSSSLFGLLKQNPIVFQCK